jgi:beta-lactamase regulating signal transducer with metallopeptidase domain
MMAAEALSMLIWGNLTLAVAIMVVLAVRIPVRRGFGARIAYGLWLAPPAAVLAWLVPGRQVEVEWVAATVTSMAPVTASAPASGPSLAALALLVWVVGVALALTIFGMRQRRFLTALGPLRPLTELGDSVFASESPSGPVVVGVLRPRIVLPADFARRFTPEERALVLAHEHGHLARRDPMVNAIAVLVRSLGWFNPFVHIAAGALRIDQELACDARVLAAARAPRCYAGAMVKSHGVQLESPLGCAWPDQGFHPLKTRLAMLQRGVPSAPRRAAGLVAVALTTLGAATLVWGLRPVEVVAATPVLTVKQQVVAPVVPTARPETAPAPAAAAPPIQPQLTPARAPAARSPIQPSPSPTPAPDAPSPEFALTRVPAEAPADVAAPGAPSGTAVREPVGSRAQYEADLRVYAAAQARCERSLRRGRLFGPGAAEARLAALTCVGVPERPVLVPEASG